MGDLINLNRARKAKVRGAAKAQAEANRAKFGRTKAEKASADRDQSRHEQRLDDAKRDRPPS